MHRILASEWLGIVLAIIAGTGAVASVVVTIDDREYKSGIEWPEPEVIDPGPAQVPVGPPSDAIVLFGGTDLSHWKDGENWKISDGVATASRTGITTKESFGDCQLHIEFATPAVVKGSGQGRGNSGVYMMERYEIQILDSFDNKTYFDGQCGAIYKEQPPTVNACRKPGEWQTYDIIWEGPRFDDAGHVTRPAIVTVLHNGVLIHHRFELLGATSYEEPPKYSKHPDKAPIHLQFHGDPVRFRNIWVREQVQPLAGKRPAVAESEKNASQ
jgi:hypothetical protein